MTGPVAGAGWIGQSGRNAIPLAASADETARLLRAAKTDAQRAITYEPETRPEVANLLLLAALCEGSEPRVIAEQIGSGGASALKRRVTDAVNETLAPIRCRREDRIADRGYLREVLHDGSARARATAERTLSEVTAAMHTSY